LAYSSCQFVAQLKQMNNDLHSYHYTSLNYLTEQQSRVAQIISTHNLDIITETANAISYLKSMESQSFKRLNRNTHLKRQCWLHNFYQLNAMSSESLTMLANCSIDHINSTIALSKTYFHTMVNELLYQSTLGTTNILYTIGLYNPYSEQWKISKVLEGAVKFSSEGWNGTMTIVNGEVQQIRQGIEASYQKLEECDSKVVQKFLNTKIEITDYMNKC